MNTINTICISGGGLKGLSFVSALDVLIKHNYIDIILINKYVGTSFGAIIGFLLNIGYTPEEIIIYLNNFDKKLLSFDFDLNLFLSNNGFCDSSKFIDFIKVLLNLKLRLKDINFKDLEILTKKKLLVITTNFSKGSKKVFSSDTTPLVSVITAISMSISIPLLMIPIKYDGDIYVDGCITSNLGVEYCDPLNTLCICFQKQKYFDYNNLSNIINGIIDITINSKDTSNFLKLEIIKYKCSYIVECDDNICKSLIDNGTKSGLKFLKKEYLNKIKLLQSEINLLYIKNHNQQNINNVSNNEVVTNNLSNNEVVTNNLSNTEVVTNNLSNTEVVIENNTDEINKILFELLNKIILNYK